AGAENKCHFYAEPHCDPGDHHLAMALKASKIIFTNQSAFDLEVDPTAHPAPIPVVDPGLGFGLDQSDEERLVEPNGCAGGNNPADCGQMGVGLAYRRKKVDEMPVKNIRRPVRRHAALNGTGGRSDQILFNVRNDPNTSTETTGGQFFFP